MRWRDEKAPAPRLKDTAPWLEHRPAPEPKDEPRPLDDGERAILAGMVADRKADAG